MQQKLDTAAGFPFVVVGEVALCCSAQALATWSDHTQIAAAHDAYYIFALGADRSAAIARLAEFGVDPSLCLFLGSEQACSFGSGSLAGPVENTEEYKNKIFMALRLQRQRHLAAILSQARIPASASLEAAQLAHSLSCLTEMSPGRQRTIVQLALDPLPPPETPWGPSLAIDEYLALTARLAAAHWRQPAEFRELLRLRSAALPFRLRTELRSLAERTLESVWRHHAA